MPTGFMAAISKGQHGEELTEMVELAEAGAAAFTDDGRPVVSAGLMRPRAAVQRAHGAPARAALRGAVALPRRARPRRWVSAELGSARTRRPRRA